MSIYRAGKRHKYGAKATVVDGQSFPSQLEASVYRILCWREQIGELIDVRRQTSVLLKDGCEVCGANPIRWKVDFSATETKTGKTLYVEAKGVETGDYKRKKRLWRLNPPGRLEIWRGNSQTPKCVEVIE